MKGFKGILHNFIRLTSLLLLIPLSAAAEKRAPMFNNQNPTDIFDCTVLEGQQDTGIEYFPSKCQPKEFIVEETGQKVSKNREADPKKELLKALGKPDPDELKTAEDIKEKFGDPNDPTPVYAKTDAPAPFQAMMAAMELGDQKLAFQYAKQYARYMRDFQSRTNEVSRMIEVALMKAGVRQDVSDSPRYDPIRSAIESDKEQKEMEEQHKALMKKLPKDARDMINKAKEEVEKDYEPEKSENEEAFDENLERRKLRVELAQKLPRDPKGELSIYFFFQPLSKEALKMGPEIEKLYQRSKSDPRLKIMGFTMTTVTEDKLTQFRNATGSSFPLINNGQLAKSLKLTKSPTTVIMTDNSGQSVFEEGYRKFYYLDEAVNIMQGK
ncbi:MAG: hypothetical protein D6719_02990 [Candidatus Dadabacteria bacterium]|nr:MAG: hypothetical protein D6719_02990 [Candidatus Dadabacteria bacterium]